jgi:predicted nuclease of restriction endonuclease-like (RecB) superfamily
MTKPVANKKSAPPATANYSGLVSGVSELLEAARRASVRTVNAFMTATYWEVGRRIVDFEQGGEKQAVYGESLLLRLADDLTARFGKGFGKSNLFLMRKFYLASAQIFQTPSGKLAGSSSATPIFQTLSGIFEDPKRATASLESQGPEKCQTPSGESCGGEKRSTLSNESGELPIAQTLSAKSDAPSIRPTPSSTSETPSRKLQTPSAQFNLAGLARAFPLPWSHYVQLISRSRSPEAFAFYHTEALRGGWSVRQLARQIDSQFYERTALSRNKAAMLAKGAKPQPGDAVSADEEIRHPLVLEFLGLRDEYSETDLEDALIRHLETFLLELGNDFAFVGRQRRLRIDDEWYRVDLLFFHRRLRCLVIFDLKLGRFTHADAGQMHVYLNYAREHWSQPGENPPVGVILCSGKGEALVRYATDALPTKLLVREYLTALPDEKVLAAELEKTRKQLESRK